MAQTYATSGDYVALFGAVADTARVDALLDAAYVKVLPKVPDLEKRVLSGDVSADLVKITLCEMVQAVLRNPDGARSEAQNAGPFGTSKSWDPVSASGRLVLTDEQLELLVGSAHGAYSVSAKDDGLPTVSWPMRRSGDHWYPAGDWQ